MLRVTFVIETGIHCPTKGREGEKKKKKRETQVIKFAEGIDYVSSVSLLQKGALTAPTSKAHPSHVSICNALHSSITLRV